jgi:hypothetical protein
MHRDPNTNPTPGANYGAHTPAELANALNTQSAYACEHWQAGGGVVGPNGSEGNWPYSGYNNPTDPNYEQYQGFAYQHDLQATDADLQHTSQNEGKYNRANMLSAVEGMWVLRRTGDVNQALRKTQDVFGSYGFTVRQSY